MLELVSDIDGTTIGPFSYGVSERRGKWSLTTQSPFGADESTLSSKLDVSPPPWLEPVRRGWVRMPIHATYGVPALPELQVVRLEENIAEKISRPNRTTTARDLYDLAWLVTHQRDMGDLNTDLIRRIVALKIWVDAHGVTAGSMRWRAGHGHTRSIQTIGYEPVPHRKSTSRTSAPWQSQHPRWPISTRPSRPTTASFGNLTPKSGSSP